MYMDVCPFGFRAQLLPSAQILFQRKRPLPIQFAKPLLYPDRCLRTVPHGDGNLLGMNSDVSDCPQVSLVGFLCARIGSHVSFFIDMYGKSPQQICLGQRSGKSQKSPVQSQTFPGGKLQLLQLAACLDELFHTRSMIVDAKPVQQRQLLRIDLTASMIDDDELFRVEKQLPCHLDGM